MYFLRYICATRVRSKLFMMMIIGGGKNNCVHETIAAAAAAAPTEMLLAPRSSNLSVRRVSRPVVHQYSNTEPNYELRQQ